MTTLPITQKTPTTWTCPFCDLNVYSLSGMVRGTPGDTCTNCGAKADESCTEAAALVHPAACPTCGQEIR